MRKHFFEKEDCKCTKRATHYVCRYCKAREYGAPREIQRLNANRARCDHPEAPEARPEERFKALLGGTFDCLAPEACPVEEVKQ